MTLKEFKKLSKGDKFKWHRRYRTFKRFYQEHKARQKWKRGTIDEKLLKRYRLMLKRHYFRLLNQVPTLSWAEALHEMYGDPVRFLTADDINDNHFLSRVQNHNWTGGTISVPFKVRD